MYPNELAGVQLSEQFGKGLAHQVHFTARVNLDVITRGRKSVDVIDRDEVSAGAIADQNLLEGRRLPGQVGQNAPHPLVKITLVGVRQFGFYALDTAQKSF